MLMLTPPYNIWVHNAMLLHSVTQRKYNKRVIHISFISFSIVVKTNKSMITVGHENSEGGSKSEIATKECNLRIAAERLGHSDKRLYPMTLTYRFKRYISELFVVSVYWHCIQ